MLGSKNLTETPQEQRITAPGMAHWAGSGPPGKACGQCRFRGYWAPKKHLHGLGTDVKSQGCEKFFHLTGVHGPALQNALPACKYFEEKPSAKKVW